MAEHPKAAPAPAPDACETCTCFTAGNTQAAAKRGIPNTGRCRRYPQALPKNPDEWCAEWRGK